MDNSARARYVVSDPDAAEQDVLTDAACYVSRRKGVRMGFDPTGVGPMGILARGRYVISDPGAAEEGVLIDGACYISGGTVVEVGDYELLKFEVGRGWPRWTYLKMVNPSTSTYHIEGVHPDCKTVKAALEFRNSTTEVPEKLT